jgi:hypothetical protein
VECAASIFDWVQIVLIAVILACVLIVISILKRHMGGGPLQLPRRRAGRQVTTMVARQKVSTRNVEVGTYLTDGVELYEVRKLGDVRAIRVGDRVVPAVGRLRLVNCRTNLPVSMKRELNQGAWVPFEEAIHFEVVVPASSAD